MAPPPFPQIQDYTLRTSWPSSLVPPQWPSTKQTGPHFALGQSTQIQRQRASKPDLPIQFQQLFIVTILAWSRKKLDRQITSISGTRYRIADVYHCTEVEPKGGEEQMQLKTVKERMVEGILHHLLTKGAAHQHCQVQDGIARSSGQGLMQQVVLTTHSS